MKKEIYRNNTRGFFDYGWLKTYHSFSFSNYYDNNRIHFGKLRVLNDDTIAPATGFGLHPHDNMEIITIPLSGELRHTDSEEHSQTIKPGEVQIMSAGTGIWHSEFNNSDTEPVSLYQIWILPKEKDIQPRYDQKLFDKNQRKNQFQLLVSPVKNNETLWINQDAYINIAELDDKFQINYILKNENDGIFIMLTKGKIEVADESLEKRDSISIYDINNLKIKAIDKSELLIIEVPMN
ncbi:MAG: pirin family protein [Bacteroidetes bacterium]|nr:MAG: pirin family protein [Bacteroidota bacterium]